MSLALAPPAPPTPPTSFLSMTALLNRSSTLLIEQLYELTIAYRLATSLLSITALMHRIDDLAYFWI
jgi:hypothetical protein